MSKFPSNTSNATMNSLPQTFGGSTTGINTDNYYRGGSYVPNISHNTKIPTSGQVTFPDDYIGSVDLFPADAFNGARDDKHNANANTGIVFSTNGGCYESTSNDYIGRWLNETGSGNGVGFYVYGQLISGSVASNSSPVGVWLNIANGVDFKLVAINTTKTAVLRFHFKRASGGVLLVSGNKTYTAHSVYQEPPDPGGPIDN